MNEESTEVREGSETAEVVDVRTVPNWWGIINNA
jgi:hypothetical protein